MEQLLPESWVYMHFALILVITCAQMLVIYILGDSSNPPLGLGMYTVYFMAALLGWIAFTLQRGSASTMTVDVPSVAIIINSYILFLASGQRSGVTRGRLVLGVICLLAILCGLLLPQKPMFLVQLFATTLFFLAAGLLCAWRSYTHKNLGEGIISFGAVIMVASLPFALYYLLIAENVRLAEAIAFGSYSAAYVLVAIGFLASVLIEYQGHLARLTTHDPLTQVFNRRGMDEALQLSLATARRREFSTSAIVVAIDHLPQINDTFGSGIGDHMIRKIADILLSMCRASDVVSRFEGDKFLMVLVETDLKSAKILAERIRLAVDEQPMSIDQQEISVTVSLGVTCTTGEIDIDDLSRDAGRALYIAKQGGRNQVATIDHAPVHLSSEHSQA
jgi:diguanylate cyclase (GGDEF)-like protein